MSYSVDTAKIILFCLITGGGLLFSAIRRHRRARNIADTPRSKAATAAQGFVELEGFAWPASVTINASNGMEAVYYSFLLQREETQGSGKNKKKTWVTVYSRLHSEPFYLIDPTGLVLVEPDLAEIDVDGGKTRLWTELDENERKRLLGEIIMDSVPNFPPPKGFFSLFGKKFRIQEHEILLGAPMHASGNFSTDIETQGEQRIHGLTSFGKKVFDTQKRSIRNVNGLLDTNRDGKVSYEEAKLGYATTAKVSRSRPFSEKDEVGFQLYGRLKSNEVHKLFVADAFEGHLQERIGRFLWLRFVGGSALVALAIAMTMGFDVNEFKNLRQKNRAVASLQKEAKSARKPASVPPPDYHANCVAGDVAACEILLVRKEQMRLTPQHINYYSARACALGKKTYCR